MTSISTKIKTNLNNWGCNCGNSYNAFKVSGENPTAVVVHIINGGTFEFNCPKCKNQDDLSLLDLED